MPRIFVPQALASGAQVALPAEAAHHVRQVLRLHAGETLTIFNGEGGEFPGELLQVDRHVVRVALAGQIRIERESPLSVTLAQGIARGERMDYIIQKAVELGVTRIVPLVTERATVRLDPARAARRLAHWRGIVQHACEQCGRNRLPELTEVRTLADFAAADGAARRCTLDPGADARLADLAAAGLPHSLAVGPEGGFSSAEREVLSAHGFVAARLGPRILRTETAALVALALLQSRVGDLG